MFDWLFGFTAGLLMHYLIPSIKQKIKDFSNEDY